MSAGETVFARNLMSDVEWAFFEPFIVAVRRPNGCKPENHRLVLDGIFWVARTGAPWRDLPEEFGKWSSVDRQYRRWKLAGLWELILEALNDSRAAPDSVQIVASAIVRAHQHVAGAKTGLRKRGLVARRVASRPNPTSASTPEACRWGPRLRRAKPWTMRAPTWSWPITFLPPAC